MLRSNKDNSPTPHRIKNTIGANANQRQRPRGLPGVEPSLFGLLFSAPVVIILLSSFYQADG